MQTRTIPLWTLSQEEYKAIEKGTLLEVSGQKTFVQVDKLQVGGPYTPMCSQCGELFKNLRSKGMHEWFKHGIHGVNAKKAKKKSRKKQG